MIATVARTMHLWSEADFPRKEWRCIGVDDLKDNAAADGDFEYGVCEACGKERIRFVHYMTHEAYPRVIATGCMCAGRLEEDVAAPRERELKAERRAGRRSRWLSRKWKRSKNGGTYLRIEGFVVGTCADNYHLGKWRFWIMDPEGEFVKNYGRYDSDRQARLALFDKLSDLLDW
jgi:hypothetical protein